MHKLMIVTHHY